MNRFEFIFWRLLQTVFLLFGIIFLVFMLLQVTPGDPARAVVGQRASEESVEAAREKLGLNESLPVQYWRYLSNVLQGDLGESNKSNVEVSTLIRQRLPVTLWLLLCGSLLSIAIAIPLGALSAVHRDRGVDHAIRGTTLFGLGMPVFWVGIVLIITIALPTEWFPVGGFGGSIPERFRSIFLPALTLAIATAPLLIRSLRSSLIGVLDSDYVAAARSIGVGRTRLFRRHVLRNGVVPTISLLAVMIGYLVFGAVIIENTFALPGLGQSMVFAASGRDFPVVQGITLVFALLVTGVHLLADISIAIVDPRVRIE